jgi:cytidylate kinase
MHEEDATVMSGVRQIDSNLFVTISGPPGCGATTLADGLAESLDCGWISGGDIFREIAEERGMSLSQLIAKADENDELDRALDQRLQTVAEQWGAVNKPFILESRLAGWIAGNRADLRLWLDAPEDVRLQRIEQREEGEAEMRVREVSEAGRYESYYDIDVTDRSFYDLSINTARWTPRSTVELVLTAIEEYDPETDEGAFESEQIGF